LVGWGVVGQSLAKIFLQRKRDLAKNFGFRPRIVAIIDKGGAAINPKGLNLEEMLALKRAKGTVAANSQYGHRGMSAVEVMEDVESESMVEVSPTNIEDAEPGLSYIKTAFRTGKHVVTTNKGPLALALPALTELADYNKVCLRFSGTVGAGTPILEFAKNCLQGDKIIYIKGILNGTTNYILSKMDEKNITFDEALKEAQNLGYAEADPTMDVDGYDAAAKLVIMANWIMDRKVTIKDVKIKGIHNVSSHDPLAVDGALNAVTFVSESAGEQTIIGLGAGGMETASAVLRDLLDVKQNIAKKIT
jgi:homoserine dehydrogenase